MRGRAVVRQNDFSFGELSPEHAASGDKDAVSRSLKNGRNCRLLNSGAFTQRFGSRRLCVIPFQGIPTTLVIKDGTEFIGYIRANGMDVRDTDGNIVQSIGGAPWTTLATVREVSWHTAIGKLYVAHHDFPTQIYTYDDDAGTWSLSAFDFAAGNGGSKLQIYYRYAPLGITMQPSALTGVINVTFSDDVLDPAHVGVIFRYSVQDGLGQEIQIATVVDPQHGTATVLNELPPTVTVDVADSSGFQIGEAVKGLTSQAEGFITNIAGNTITIAMVKGYESFNDHVIDKDLDGTIDSGEYLVGAFTRSYIDDGSLVNPVTPAALVAWDEAVISPVHGYPGEVFEHASRLGFANFPDIPDGIALSVPNAPTIFDISGGDAGAAIFEILGQDRGQRIRYCMSAANLLILTTKGVYYVPEAADVPFSTETFDVVRITPAGCSLARPALVEEGAVYVEDGGKRIIALLSTGSLTSPWKSIEVSSRASHLISNPTSIATTNGSTQAPERYVMVMNDDGTIAVLFFNVDQNNPRIGWVPWDAPGPGTLEPGLYKAMTTINGFLYTSVNRTTATGEKTFLERFDADAQLDCSQTVVSGGGAVVMPDLAGEVVAVNHDTAYLGTFTVDGGGTIVGLPSIVGNVEAGYDFHMRATLWPPEPDNDQSPNFNIRRIDRIAVRVEESQSFSFGLSGQTGLEYVVPVYLPLDDQGDPPPLRSGDFRRSFNGWSDEPSAAIVRHIPQPLKVLSVAQEVPF